MTIGLVMIVRNEAEKLPACLASVRDHIDAWTICDTGSTDDTVEVALRELARVPGAIHHHDWVDFAHNRTRAVEAARGASDYLLMLDADMTLNAGAELPPLTADAYDLQVEGMGDEYRMTLLFRGSADVRYECPVHEVLTGYETRGRLDEWTVTANHDGRDEGKAFRYAKLLEQHVADHPDDARAVFYLARTFADLGLVDLAIQTFSRRLELDGFDEETYYAAYQLGCLLCAHKSIDLGIPQLLRAWRMRPSRVEPLRALANAANNYADRVPKPDDILFVDPTAYR